MVANLENIHDGHDITNYVEGKSIHNHNTQLIGGAMIHTSMPYY